jgi:hypothetical protein
MKAMLSALGSPRVSDQEAKKLDNLGKELVKKQSDPNRPKKESTKIKSSAQQQKSGAK